MITLVEQMLQLHQQQTAASDAARDLYQRQTARPAVLGVDATDRETARPAVSGVDRLVASRELP